MDLKATSTGAVPDKKQPEKYIRTFAGDMEILKSGGTPNLTPLITPVEESPDASPAPPAPTLQTAPVSKPPMLIQSPAAPKPAPVDSLKTYAGDFTDRVEETHASAVTVLAAEQDATTRAPQAEPQESPRANIPFIIAGVVFLVAGAVGGYFAYTHYLATTAPVVVAPSVPTPIFVDEREEVSGTGPAIIRAIQSSVARPLTSGTVRLLSVATTSSESVFSALAAVSAPGTLLRNVKSEGSMAGVINAGSSQSPFFILSVLSYSDTFAGMLAWEPVMPLYLTDLYPPYPTPVAPITTLVATTTATTTQTKTATTTKKISTTKPVVNPPVATSSLQVVLQPAPLPAIHFSDTTIANHDARAYRDSAGRTILVYGYWNSSTLVIARDTAAFTEIMQRLATARTP